MLPLVILGPMGKAAGAPLPQGGAGTVIHGQPQAGAPSTPGPGGVGGGGASGGGGDVGGGGATGFSAGATGAASFGLGVSSGATAGGGSTGGGAGGGAAASGIGSSTGPSRRGRGWRDWRRGDPTLIKGLWKSKGPLGNGFTPPHSAGNERLKGNRSTVLYIHNLHFLCLIRVDLQ